MRNTIKYLMVVAGAMGLFISVTTSNSEVNNDLSLSNIKSLQASAGEMYCDQSNETSCRIETSGGTGYSKGYLIYKW